MHQFILSCPQVWQNLRVVAHPHLETEISILVLIVCLVAKLYLGHVTFMMTLSMKLVFDVPPSLKMLNLWLRRRQFFYIFWGGEISATKFYALGRDCLSMAKWLLIYKKNRFRGRVMFFVIPVNKSWSLTIACTTNVLSFLLSILFASKREHFLLEHLQKNDVFLVSIFSLVNDTFSQMP